MLDDFAAGIDLRKSAITAPAGTLRWLKNATINAGGEIEKRKTLTAIGVLPAGTTHGLAFKGTSLWVFGTAASFGAALPSYVQYQRLLHSNAALVIGRILDVQVFNSKFYVVARMSDGSIAHFHDGALVTDPAHGGLSIRAHKDKLFSVGETNIRFSAIRNATNWSTGTGAGVIDVTTADADETELVGLEEYFGSLAVFGRSSVQVWSMDPDPALSTIRQVLGNTGLVTSKAVARFGSGDVLFLADTGIRSLRARDIQSAAAVNDIGAPVDNLIASRRATLTQADAEKITALVDPLSGHFWLVWGQEAFVLSAYPQSKVSAWAVFDFGSDVDHVTRAGSRIAVRRGDELFVYGSVADGNPFDPNTPIGVSAALYDNSPVEVVTSFLDAKSPASRKTWEGLDITCSGTWDVFVCPQAPNEAIRETPAWVKIATVTQPSWGLDRIPIDMVSNHLALKFETTDARAATISSVAIHFTGGEQT